MILSTIKTIWQSNLDLLRSFNMEYYPMENTSLNEKYSILLEYTPDKYIYPTLQYYSIGTGIPLSLFSNPSKYSYHSSVDGSLYNQIPFVIRELDNDLNKVEQLLYRHRVVQNINGKQCVCYYLKQLSNLAYKNKLYKLINYNTSDNITYSIKEAIDIDKVLSPTLQDITIDKPLLSRDYYAVLGGVTIMLSETDIQNILDSMDMLNITDKVITEIALCNGVDVEPDNSGKKEAIYVQTAYFIDVNLNLVNIMNENKYIDLYLNLYDLG